MTTAAVAFSNPLDPLVLKVVLGWVSVVFRQRKRCGWLDPQSGRPWTRLPAKDIAEQLEREQGLTVSVRRIQRSLERLSEGGHLARFQRLKKWGVRSFWYSWSNREWDLQQHRPTAVSRRQSATVPTETSELSEATPVTLHSSTGSDSSYSTSSPKPPSHRPADGKNRESNVGVVGAAPKASAAVKGQQALQRLLEGAARRLSGVNDRATPETSSKGVAASQRVVSKVGRYLVVDDPATAFIG